MTAVLFCSAIFVLILDQISKNLALNWSDKASGTNTRIGPGIHPINNFRIGFGFVRNTRVLVFLWICLILGIVVLISWFTPLQRPIALIGLGSALGGATGNLIDMLRRGAVVDFIDLRIWPVFNFADLAIVLGVVVAMWPTMVVD